MGKGEREEGVVVERASEAESWRISIVVLDRGGGTRVR